VETTLPVTRDYELRIVSDGGSVLVGELFAIDRRSGGQQLFSEIGKVSAHQATGDADEFRSHWKLCILLRGTPKDEELLSHAIVRALLKAKLCDEPVWAQVYRGRIITVLDGYGELTYDE
jgi:hypothetical protein